MMGSGVRWGTWELKKSDLNPFIYLFIYFFVLTGSLHALYKSSTRMIRGKPYSEDVVRVANESACMFPLLETCVKLKNSKSDCKHLT